MPARSPSVGGMTSRAIGLPGIMFATLGVSPAGCLGLSEVAQSCLTLCDPMDCSLPGSFSGKSTGVGCHFLLQGIFPTQESNPGLPHCRQTLYHLSHQGSPLDYKGNPSAFSFYLSFFLRQGLGGGKTTGLSSKSTSCLAKSNGTHTEKNSSQ